jgi:hypothetical protein
MPNEMEMDPRERTAEEIEDMFHNAGRVARSAVMTEDRATKNTLNNAVRALADEAIRRLDESIGTSEADQQMDEDE